MDSPKYQTDNENERSSDEQTISPSPTYENLLYENKMKSQALLKASNLIEILKCQLEVEKNAHEEALLQAVQLAKDQAKAGYRIQLEQLKVKIQLLERQIERQNSTRRDEFSKSKEIIPTKNTVMIRNKSASSLSHSKSRQKNLTRNRSVNKKLQQPNQQPLIYSFEKNFYKQIMVGYQEREERFVHEFTNLFEREKEQISTYSLNNRRYSDEFSHIYKSEEVKPSYEDEIEEMRAVIEKQETLIDSMKIYQMELEDLIKGLTIKISSIFPEQKQSEHERNRLKLSEVMKKMHKEAKVAFAEKYNILVEENQQLRNIIEKMIHLIREKKECN